MKNYFDLKGQVAIVTGCSGGLGVQMAKALANQGANIVVVARRQNLIEQVAKEISEEFGVETLPVRCDITSTEQVEAMVDTVVEKFGRIDILINNAGTGAVAPAEDITDEQFENRMYLQNLMKRNGFEPLDCEWWHFTLANEPFPDTYFDFPVSGGYLRK